MSRYLNETVISSYHNCQIQFLSTRGKTTKGSFLVGLSAYKVHVFAIQSNIPINQQLNFNYLSVFPLLTHCNGTHISGIKEDSFIFTGIFSQHLNDIIFGLRSTVHLE